MEDRKMKIRIIIILTLALSIVAGCGGGGGGGSSSDNDSSNQNISNIVSTEQLVDSKIILGSDSASVRTISSGAFGDVNLDGESEINQKIAEEALIAAYDELEQIVYLSAAKPNQEIVELNADTTVEALLMLVPDIALMEESLPGTFNNTIAALPTTVSLSDYIKSNSDWSQSSDEFIQKYIEAIKSAVAALNKVEPKNLALRNAKNTSNVGLTPSAKAVFIDNGLSEGVVARSHKKSGVEVVVRSENENEFDIDLANGYHRFVIAMIGEDPSLNNDPLEIGDGSTFILGSGKISRGSTSKETATIPLSVFEQELDTFGVYVYGPSISDFEIPNTGQAETAFWYATAYTTIFNIAIPVYGKIAGASGCLEKTIGFKGRSKIAQSIAKSNDIRTSIRQNDYTTAGIEAGQILIKSIVNQGLVCTLDAGINLAAKLTPFLGHVKLALDIIETTDLIGSVLFSLHQSNAIEYWHINNTHGHEFRMDGEGTLDLSPRGSLGYKLASDLDMINSDLRNEYSGDCPTANDPNIKGYTCHGYTYLADDPYLVDFEVTCLDPVDSQNMIPCSKAYFWPDQEAFLAEEVVADFDGVIRINHQYGKAGEFSGRIDTYDSDSNVYQKGTETTHRFHVQITGAEPQLLALDLKELEVLETVKIGDSLETIEKLNSLCCPEEGVMESDIRVVNFGKGTARIDSITTRDIKGLEIEVEDSYPIYIDRLDGLDIKVKISEEILSVDPSELEDIEIVVSGDLGGETMDQLTDPTGVFSSWLGDNKYYEYNSLKIGINLSLLPPIAVINNLSPIDSCNDYTVFKFSSLGSYDPDALDGDEIKYEWMLSEVVDWVKGVNGDETVYDPLWSDEVLVETGVLDIEKGNEIELTDLEPKYYNLSLRLLDEDGKSSTVTSSFLVRKPFSIDYFPEYQSKFVDRANVQYNNKDDHCVVFYPRGYKCIGGCLAPGETLTCRVTESTTRQCVRTAEHIISAEYELTGDVYGYQLSGQIHQTQRYIILNGDEETCPQFSPLPPDNTSTTVLKGSVEIDCNLK